MMETGLNVCLKEVLNCPSGICLSCIFPATSSVEPSKALNLSGQSGKSRLCACNAHLGLQFQTDVQNIESIENKTC